MNTSPPGALIPERAPIPWRYPLSARPVSVTLIFDATPTPGEIDRLIEYLHLTKTALRPGGVPPEPDGRVPEPVAVLPPAG